MTTLNQRAVELYNQAQQCWLPRSKGTIERELIVAASKGHKGTTLLFSEFPDALMEDYNLDTLVDILKNNEGLDVFVSYQHHYIEIMLKS